MIADAAAETVDVLGVSFPRLDAAKAVQFLLSRLAAATSTGGLNAKMAGRVGDSPIIGAGTSLSRAHLRQWTEALGRTALPEFLPDNVLVAHPDMLAWWIPTQVRPAYFALTDPPAGLQVLQSVGDAWSWQVGLPGARRRSDQDEGVRRVVAATRAIIESLRAGLGGRKVVVVIDGLDRIRGSEAFKGLFVESDLLRSLPCDVVVSAHLAMVQRYRGSLRFDERYDLANEPVADRHDPWKPGPRIGFFRDLVDRRLAAIAGRGLAVPPDVLPDPLLERLAWCSGGRLRDFMGFMRAIALMASSQYLTSAEPELVERMIDKERRLRSDGLNADEIALLEGLARDPTHRLPGSDLAIELLEQQLILAYPNENAWYLPHPLLMIALIRPG